MSETNPSVFARTKNFSPLACSNRVKPSTQRGMGLDLDNRIYIGLDIAGLYPGLGAGIQFFVLYWRTMPLVARYCSPGKNRNQPFSVEARNSPRRPLLHNAPLSLMAS